MSRGNVLIVGGGIGGLSAAIAIKNVGFDVLVVERYADMHASVFGVGIIQPINAMRALDAIGCADACMEEGYQAADWAAKYDVSGNFLFPIPGTRIEGSRLPIMNGITRPKLHSILTRKAVEVGVEIRYSTTAVDVIDHGDRVEVVLEGGESLFADILVGADGSRSKVRRHVIGDDLQLRYIGQSAYRMNMPLLPEIDRIILQEGPEGMAGFVPIGKDLAYFFYNAHQEKDEHKTQDQLRAELRKHLAPFGGLTGRFRDEFLDNEDEEIVLRPEESLISPAPWHKGRIVLMGDAVHAVTPHLGQGAAQAIEDGVVLAEEMARTDDLEDAFAVYTERRFERCRLIVQTSLDIGEWEMGRLPDFDNVAATTHVLKVMAQPL